MGLDNILERFAFRCDQTERQLSENDYHCRECDRQVVDLNSMTESQAEQYLQENPGGCMSLRLDGWDRPIFREPMDLQGRPGWQGRLAGAILSLPMLLAGCDSSEECASEPAPIAVGPDGARLQAEHPGGAMRASAPSDPSASMELDSSRQIRDAARVFLSYPSEASVYYVPNRYERKVYLGETPLRIQVPSGVEQRYLLRKAGRVDTYVYGESLESEGTSQYMRWLDARDQSFDRFERFDRANESVVNGVEF